MTIQSLTDFTVATEYGRNHTAFTIREQGRSAPIAVARKDTNFDSRGLFEVYVGPQSDQLAGFVQIAKAWAADRAPIGVVEHKHRALGHDRWTFSQNGLGTLEGRPTGLSRLRESFLLGIVLGNKWADLFLARRLRFRSPESAGFELTRVAGPKDRYRVRIRDPRVDRLLVLSCILYLARFGDTLDLRKDLVELSSNPFRNM